MHALRVLLVLPVAAIDASLTLDLPQSIWTGLQTLEFDQDPACGSNRSWHEAPFETKDTLLLLPTASGSQSRIAKCLDLVVLQNRQCLFANLFDRFKLFSADVGCTHLMAREICTHCASKISMPKSVSSVRACQTA